MGLFAKRNRNDPAPGVPDGLERDRRKRGRHFGEPTPCPGCGGSGFLQYIDPTTRVQTQRCRDCHHEWETDESTFGAPRG